MKKLKKLELTDVTLSKQEIEMLKGGTYAEDVTNENIVAGCKCEYSNFSRLTNSNDIDGCKCTCI